MASKVLLCHLCGGNPADKSMTNVFTMKSIDRGWASQISTLLDISVSQNDLLPPHVCSKCITRVTSLEKATIDLASFKRLVRLVMQQVQQPLKRPKETSGEVGVSLDTLRQRPRSKIPRRLPFTRMCTHYDTGSGAGQHQRSNYQSATRKAQ